MDPGSSVGLRYSRNELARMATSSSARDYGWHRLSLGRQQQHRSYGKWLVLVLGHNLDRTSIALMTVINKQIALPMITFRLSLDSISTTEIGRASCRERV